jgi:hypothetical protein
MIVRGGLALLIGLAVVIGRLDTQARDDAWRRIARARREQHERERALRRCMESPRCTRCPVDRYFRGW